MVYKNIITPLCRVLIISTQNHLKSTNMKNVSNVFDFEYDQTLLDPDASKPDMPKYNNKWLVDYVKLNHKLFFLIGILLLAIGCTKAVEGGSFGFESPVSFSSKGGVQTVNGDYLWDVDALNEDGEMLHSHNIGQDTNQEKIEGDWFSVEYIPGVPTLTISVDENFSGKPRKVLLYLYHINNYGYVEIEQD